jgi:hypothetical protein
MEPAGCGQGDVVPAIRPPPAPHADAPGAGPQCECAKDSGGRAARGEAPSVRGPFTPSHVSQEKGRINEGSRYDL